MFLIDKMAVGRVKCPRFFALLQLRGFVTVKYLLHMMSYLAAAMIPSAAVGQSALPEEEPEFAFRKRIEVVHQSDRRDPDFKPAKDEFVFRDGVRLSGPDDPLVKRGIEDFTDYLATSMGVKAGSSASAGGIDVALDASLADRQYTVAVDAKGVKIRAKNGRAAMQALFHLEDLMNLRRGPALAFGQEKRRMRFSPRMTHSGWGVDQFPDNHLATIAHAGFDAILFYISGIDRTHAPGKTDIAALIDAAAAWGLDSYLYSSLKTLKNPEDPGCAAQMAATYGAAAKRYRKAKGFLIVPESCFFESRDPRIAKPTGSSTFPCSDHPLWLKRMEDALRAEIPDVDFIFWTYNFYSRAEELRFAFIDNITPSTILNVTFAIGTSGEHKTRLGASFPVADYSIATSGPSGLFRAEAAHAHARGLRLFTTCNTAGRTWDFGCCPYEPVPQRWKARFDALKKAQDDWGLSGLIESHHYGFTPNFIAELAKEAFTEGGMDFDTHLRKIAEREFGPAHADETVAVWADLSDAIQDYVATSSNQWGPFRIGPAFPFNALGKFFEKGDWLDYRSIICNPNYGWSHPWGGSKQKRYRLNEKTHKIEIELFSSAGRRFVAGAGQLRGFAKELMGERRNQALREAGIVEYIGRSFLTMANVKAAALEEAVAIDETKPAAAREAARRKVFEIAREEYANTVAALPLVKADSHLGFECVNRYMGSRARIEWKLRHMEKLYGIKP